MLFSGWANHAHAGGFSILRRSPMTWVLHCLGFGYWSQLCLMYGSQLAPIAEIVMNASQAIAIHIVIRPRRRCLGGTVVRAATCTGTGISVRATVIQAPFLLELSGRSTRTRGR